MDKLDTIGKRIKYLRKEHLCLNQTNFAGPLGLTHAAIGAYEKGLRNVSEPSIIAICRHYGVNEAWLREGSGEMLTKSPNNIISDLAKEYDLDSADCYLIEEYLKLDKESRNVLKKYIQKVYLHFDNTENEIEKEVEAYRKELIDEKKKASSVSDTPNAKEA